jgi:predicted pyridoxine 5'-phosphate oxidase superfamily flavin-nucleotide-binding protein
MGKVHDGIDAALREFIEAQRMFFVATAPAGGEGHVNVSPKGLDSLRVLDEKTVAYLDFNGSGVETIAHLRDYGRITLMLCAFEGPPKIVRLHGKGDAVEPSDERFAGLRARLPEGDHVRSVILVNVERVSDSCGFSVPTYRYEGQRSQLVDWAEKKGADKLVEYRQKENAKSIDGLAGLRSTEGASED